MGEAYLSIVAATNFKQRMREMMEYYYPFGLNQGVPAGVVAPHVGLTPEQVERVYKDIEAKRSAAHYLHEHALFVEPVL